MGMTQFESRADVRAVAAVVVATLSVVAPVVGTLVAIVTVWFAARTSEAKGSQRLVRMAAIITVVVVLLHLAFAVVVTPTSMEVGPAQTVRIGG